MSPLVDYHVHLDLFQEHEELTKQCAREGVEVFTMTTTPLAWSRNRQIAGAIRGIRIGLGLHPQLVAERGSEIELFEQLAPNTFFIGEVGLDAGPLYYPSFEAQQHVFNRILAIAAKTAPKILSIHSVRCVGKVLSAIESQCRGASDLRFVLHWFSGSKAEAFRAAKMGCYFSVNPMMLRTDRGRELVRALPIERLLTETDGPFTKDRNGGVFLPAKAAEVARELAGLFGRPEKWARDTVWENTRQLERIIVST